MRNNNRGFSYVEMIVVLAILTVMGSMITISIGLVNRNNINRTSEKLESAFNQARVSAMTKGTANGYLNLAAIDGNYYVALGEKMDAASDVKKYGEKIGPTSSMDIEIKVPVNPTNLGAGFKVEYTTEDGAKNADGDAYPAVYNLSFEQVSGGPKDNLKRIVIVRKNSDKEVSFAVAGSTGKITR